MAHMELFRIGITRARGVVHSHRCPPVARSQLKKYRLPSSRLPCRRLFLCWGKFRTLQEFWSGTEWQPITAARPSCRINGPWAPSSLSFEPENRNADGLPPEQRLGVLQGCADSLGLLRRAATQLHSSWSVRCPVLPLRSSAFDSPRS